MLLIIFLLTMSLITAMVEAVLPLLILLLFLVVICRLILGGFTRRGSK